jgi:TatD DNase family protein
MWDSHFHLMEMRKKMPHAVEVLAEELERGLAGGIDVAVGTEDFNDRAKALAPFPTVYLSAGLYPSAASVDYKNKLLVLEDQLRHHRVVALGETGMDLYRDYASEEAQARLFSDQVDLAMAGRLPLIIHCREAFGPVLNILEAKRPDRGVMHCFSGTFEEAKRCIDLGFFISFAGNITFPKNEELREVARKIPLERILLETDSPYLAPLPFRGRPASPSLIAYTYACLAKIRGLETGFLTEEITKNLRSCFPRIA